MLAICVTGFGYGMFHHSRFIEAGGQKGMHIAPIEEQTPSARVSYHHMQVGYGVFFGSLAIMVFVSPEWWTNGT